MGAAALIHCLGACRVAAVTGIGYATRKMLRSELSVETVAELRKFDAAFLARFFGEAKARWLYQVARGVDNDPVVDTVAGDGGGGGNGVPRPKSMSVEDSFRGCSDWANVSTRLHLLAGDLAARMVADAAAFSRRACKMRVSFRSAGTRRSASKTSALPTELGAMYTLPVRDDNGSPLTGASSALEVYAAVIARHGVKLVKRAIGSGSFALTLLGLTVLDFEPLSATPSRALTSFLAPPMPSAEPPAPSVRAKAVHFKGQARLLPPPAAPCSPPRAKAGAAAVPKPHAHSPPLRSRPRLLTSFAAHLPSRPAPPCCA